LNRASNPSTDGPTIHRWTLRADPGAQGGKKIYVPLLLFQRVANGVVDGTMDVESERNYLEGLRKTRQIVTYQEAGASTTVIVEDFSFVPYERSPKGPGVDGTFFVALKEVV
jgi:hypothetical protein